MKRVYNAFDRVRADEDLKENAYRFISNQYAKPAKRRSGGLFVAAAAAACVVLCLCSILYLKTPIGYISIDSEISVELVMDRMNRVSSASVYSTVGEDILERESVIGVGIKDALERLLPVASAEEGNVMVTVASDSASTAEMMISTVRSAALNGGCHAETAVSDPEAFKIAHAHGMSGGKYALCEQLMQLDESIEFDDCKEMNAKRISDCINEHAHGGNNDQASEDSCHEEEEPYVSGDPSEQIKFADSVTAAQPTPSATVSFETADTHELTLTVPEETPEATKIATKAPVESEHHKENSEHHGNGHH